MSLDPKNYDPALRAGAQLDSTNIGAGAILLSDLAAGILPSHVIKFARLGSTITTTALVGLAVGDLVIQFIAATSTVTVTPCAVADTLPADPADADYVVVLRAAA